MDRIYSKTIHLFVLKMKAKEYRLRDFEDVGSAKWGNVITAL